MEDIFKAKGSRTAKTASGFKLSLVKSGLQKSIRRGDMERTVKSIIELYLTQSKMGLTGIIKRIPKIAFEDIGLACPQIAEFMLDASIGWSQARKEERPADFKLSSAILVAAYAAKAPKTRVCSHLWSLATIEAGRQLAGINIDIVPDKGREYFMDGDNPKLVQLGMSFFTTLLKKDLACLYFLAEIIYEGSAIKQNNQLLVKRKIKRDVFTRPERILFNMLRNVLPSHRALLDKLELVYMTGGRPDYTPNRQDFKFADERIFLMYPVTMYFFYENTLSYPKFEPEPKLITFSKVVPVRIFGHDLDYTMIEKAFFYLRGLKVGYSLDYSDHVYDLHTGHGGGVQKFVKEGAYVNNEDMRFRIELAYEFYTSKV